MSRYRNFRTLTSPRPAQFGCLAVDSSGELVAAGAQDLFEIYLWSLQLGKLLEVSLTGTLYSLDRLGGRYTRICSHVGFLVPGNRTVCSNVLPVHCKDFIST